MNRHAPAPATAESLKDSLLEAALDGLRDLDATALLHAVGAREIARRAGSSPASIYHHYGSLTGLADAVIKRVFDPARLNPPGINELINHIRDATLPLPVAFAMHEAEFDRLTNDPEFKLRMGLYAFGGDSALERYGVHLRGLTEQLVEAAEELFESWERELRSPADTYSYIAIKSALVTGIALRHHAEPDRDWLHLFQRATVAIDLVFLRSAGDRHDLDSRRRR